ncbi:hypothetical protein HEK616_41440 [Streptomyces nigrescens]|uniref:Transposase n=1 Tax=Streptomyces nigrescens TaxID=1920 RepID=A0ABN6QWS6_STRNI|nr:hypothetical protein HEK616_41440 [Streptomyces nigrescens]
MRGRFSLRCSEAVRVVDRRQGAVNGERRRTVVERFRQLRVRALHLEVWVGAVERLVKSRERAQAARGPLDVAIRLSGFNEPVTA